MVIAKMIGSIIILIIIKIQTNSWVVINNIMIVIEERVMEINKVRHMIINNLLIP